MDKIIWKSEKEMQKELDDRIKNYKEGYSKDGFISKGKGEFSYKGMKYLIKVLRYYNHTNRFTSMSNKISDCHCVVEYPKEMKPLIDLIKEVDEYSEFLYHDTLHTWNDNQTIEEQINECHNLAKEDINSLPIIINKFQKKIESLKISLKKLEEFQLPNK